MNKVPKPMDIVLAIHQLMLPKDLNDIIVKYAVPMMYCKLCNSVVQKDLSKKRNLGWFIDHETRVSCLSCVPNLQKSYQLSKS